MNTAEQLALGLLHAGKSVLKTAVLRSGRVPDSEFSRRIGICRSCPAGHVILGKKGQVKSCGKLMMIARTSGGKRPCGCILGFKARDEAESCPLGFWGLSGQPSPSDNLASTSFETGKNPVTLDKISSMNGNVPGADGLISMDPGQSDRELNGRTRFVLDVGARRARIAAVRAYRKKPLLPVVAGLAPDLQNDPQKKTTPVSIEQSPTVVRHNFSLYDFFERVFIINLDRRPDRMDEFQRHMAAAGWPFKNPIRFRAVDGAAVKPPTWWHAGRGAWGCHQSHVRLIEQALQDGIQSMLVLEDDVFFEPDFRHRCIEFLAEVPDDWQQVYLGGQHLFQRRNPPAQVSPHVLRPYNINRTHAYGLHQRGLEAVYRWLTNYPEHAKNPSHHVDHRLGELHATGTFKVYAPVRWPAGQRESQSNIWGKVTPSRLWNGHRVSCPNVEGNPLVAVIGLHRSGSSCLAGVLHKLGVHMGDRLSGHERTGGFEDRRLARICEAAYPFPSMRLKIEPEELEGRLRKLVQYLQKAARKGGKPVGGAKYPHLCRMGLVLKRICGPELRVIHASRPLKESVASLQSRSRISSGWLGISDAECDAVQRWLWDGKRQFLDQVEHFSVEYSGLLEDPASWVDRLIHYLKLSPTAEERLTAIAHVQPGLRKHVLPQSAPSVELPGHRSDLVTEVD